MTLAKKPLSTLVALFVLSATVFAQDEGGLMDAGEFVDQNYLELANDLLSIYPPITQDEVMAYSESVPRLIEIYETKLKNVDSRGDELKSLVDDAKKQEDIVNAKIDVAKKAEDKEEEDRLKALKSTHEDRRKYLDRIRKIREQEVKVFEARIAYLKSFKESIEKASKLSEARTSGDPKVSDLLGLEKEMIESARRTSELNDKLASEAKKLNGERMNAFKERQKILDDLEKVEGTD